MNSPSARQSFAIERRLTPAIRPPPVQTARTDTPAARLKVYLLYHKSAQKASVGGLCLRAPVSAVL